jgi:hypothetical protein
LAQAILSSVLCFLTLLADSPKGLSWDFESDTAGQRPRQFMVGSRAQQTPQRWQVEQNDTNKILVLKDAATSKGRPRIALVRSPAMKNVRVSARIKIQTGHAEQGGGVVWRFRNFDNYLAAQINLTKKSVSIYRVINGNRIKFAGAPVPRLAADTWYTLRIEQKDQQIKVYLDDEMIFDAKDKHFNRAGAFGLFAPRGATTSFDDLKVLDLDETVEREAVKPDEPAPPTTEPVR